MNNLPVEQEMKFGLAIRADKYQEMINSVISDPKARARFVSAVVTAVGQNKALAKCTPSSILSCALFGESLGLSPSPQIGHFHMIPRKNKVKDANNKIIYLYDENGNILKDENGKWIAKTVMEAIFTIGYKGMKMLAINSSYYKKINMVPVKSGELIGYNPFTGDVDLKPILDPLKREMAETTGYFGYYELLNGYVETLYWSKEKMQHHADRYSDAYSLAAHKNILAGQVAESEMWKYSSRWYEDFDSMGVKTMVRQMLSRAPMSTEMRIAIDADEKTIGANLLPEMPEYIEPESFTPSPEEISEIEAKERAEYEAERGNLDEIEDEEL